MDTTSNSGSGQVENIQGERYRSFGSCIYCGSDGGRGGLRDEHIIPLSLGGRAYIEKASCRDCERETSYLDGYLARKVFWDFRVHAGVKTRNPKERPKELSARFEFGGEEHVKNLPIDDHPFFTVLPALQPPGLLIQAPPSITFNSCKAHSYYLFPDNLHGVLGIGIDEELGVRARGELNIRAFARAIARIAYCNAVCKFGLTGFRSLVMPDLILGKYPHVSYFVGGDGADILPAPGPENVLHTVGFRLCSYKNQRLLTASVRLFANSGTDDIGMPFYDVVVGAPRGW